MLQIFSIEIRDDEIEKKLTHTFIVKNKNSMRNK